jgi:hypothetical protein
MLRDYDDCCGGIVSPPSLNLGLFGSPGPGTEAALLGAVVALVTSLSGGLFRPAVCCGTIELSRVTPVVFPPGSFGSMFGRVSGR